MAKVSFTTLTVVICLALWACGPKAKPPVTGADLVATAVAARYVVDVDDVKEVDGRYEWTVSAVNGSDYAWKGTFYVKLVDAENEIVESHDFDMGEMVPPGGKTTGLQFTSKYAPSDMDGAVTMLKAEVDVTDYKER
jgi:hypothetical protein